MRLGLWSPIVVQVPSVRAPWEAEAGVAELTEVAQTADRLGYHYITCSEHLAIAPGLWRGTTFWDPCATLSYLAAKTTQIRLLPFVLVIGFHHPLALAKQYGTLDAISGGRLILGFGIGNVREEFDSLDLPFEDRGRRADDALRALRASLSKPLVAYSGPYFEFSNVAVEPHAIQPRVPIWVGGHTRRALARAVDLGDGWLPTPSRTSGLTLDRISEMLSWFDPPEGFDVVITPDQPLDAVGEPGPVSEVIHQASRVGTLLNVHVRHRSLAHYLEQIEAVSQLARNAA